MTKCRKCKQKQKTVQVVNMAYMGTVQSPTNQGEECNTVDETPLANTSRPHLSLVRSLSHVGHINDYYSEMHSIRKRQIIDGQSNV